MFCIFAFVRITTTLLVILKIPQAGVGEAFKRRTDQEPFSLQLVSMFNVLMSVYNHGTCRMTHINVDVIMFNVTKSSSIAFFNPTYTYDT